MRRPVWLACTAVGNLMCVACLADKDKPVPPPIDKPSQPPSASPSGERPTESPAQDAVWAKLPAVAVWRRSAGRPSPGQPPASTALRAALWDDGRVVFAEERGSWGSALRQGQIDRETMKSVLREISDTGVFDLRGNTYLVPDAPVLVTLVRVADRQQILYWDEVELPNYGINIQPKAHHLEFKKVWYAIGKALSDHLPTDSSPFPAAFVAPPAWYVKPAVQSD